jgi:hypothetical protein
MESSVDFLIKLIGHDGSEIIWPNQDEPRRRAGHTHHEMQYVARKLGYYLVDYKPGFGYAPPGETKLMTRSFLDAWVDVLSTHDGVLSGSYKGRINNHAVAWNAKEGLIYDPTGYTAYIDQFDPLYFHAAVRS